MNCRRLMPTTSPAEAHIFQYSNDSISGTRRSTPAVRTTGRMTLLALPRHAVVVNSGQLRGKSGRPPDAAEGPSLTPRQTSVRLNLGITASFDHLVSAGEERGRNAKAERLGGLHIDDQLALRRKLDWQITGRGALQNLLHENSGMAKAPSQIDPIADQPTGFHVFAISIDGWKPFRCGQHRNLWALIYEH